MIEAVIFDMDGVIIDSEPLWAEAQKEIFTSIGVDYSEELAKKTIGTGAHDTIDFWYRHQPWEGLTFQEVEDKVNTRLIELIRQKGKMMDGLIGILEFFKAKGLKIALASGSRLFLINLITEQLGVKHYFEVIHSVDFEEYGKPNPAVFLTTAKKLDVSPLNCLVVEDSFNGLIAAKAARMKALAYLSNGEYSNSRYDFADLKLKSFREFDEQYYNYLQNLV